MKTCQYCGESNRDDDRQCGRCGRWLGGEGDLADLPSLPPPPAAPMAGADAQPAPRGRRRLLLLAAMPLVLIAGVVGILLLREGGDSMPASIDGVPRMTTDQERARADAVEETMESNGGKARLAAYGTGSSPSFVVVVFEEPTEVGFDEEFRAFSFGFMGTSGVDLDPASVIDETDGGVRYRCQSNAEETTSVCVMRGSRFFTGLAVLESGGPDAAIALARKVQAATAGVSL